MGKADNLKGMHCLERLMLKSNPISRLSDLDGLECAQPLKHLSLQNMDSSDFCPVCLQPGYRARVRELLPDLVALDSKRWHLPDLDQVVARFEQQHEVEIPEPEAWFTPSDLDLADIMSEEAVNLALQPVVSEFEDALASCQEALREAE